MPRKSIGEDAGKGGIAKSNKEAYEELKSIAKAFGLSESEAFVQAVELFKQAKLLENLDPKCFLAGYNFAINLMRQNLLVLLGLSKIMVSEYMVSQMDLLRTLDQMRAQMMEQLQQQVQTQEREQKPSVPPEVRQMMMQTMMQMLLKMLGNLGGPAGDILKSFTTASQAAQATSSSAPAVEE